MRRYLTADAAFALPDGFVDHSVNMFEWPVGTGADKVGLVVQRDTLPNGRSFAAYVAGETKDYESKFESYRLEAEEETQSHLAEVRIKRFRFKKGVDVLYAHQAFVCSRARIWVFTSTALAAYREEVDSVVRDVVDSLELGEVG